MHTTEMYLVRMLSTIRACGITRLSDLRRQHKLFGDFTDALRLWMCAVGLRTQECRDIIRRRGLNTGDVSSDILRKLLEPERRIDRDTRRPFLLRLHNSLHPQMDLILSCNAASENANPIGYLMRICSSCCEGICSDEDPAVPVDPELLGHPDVWFSDGHTAASAAEEMVRRENIIAIVSCLDGEDFLHDFSILGRRVLRMKCASLLQLLLSGQALSAALKMTDAATRITGVDCRTQEALGSFLAAAARYTLPEEYRRDPEKLRSKLYQATASPSMRKLGKRIRSGMA